MQIGVVQSFCCKASWTILSVGSEKIRAEYRNGVLTSHMTKLEESKPKQIKISVPANGK